MLALDGNKVDMALNIDVPFEEIIERIEVYKDGSIKIIYNL